MLLLEMALLNEEIDLFESVLANSSDPIPLYNTFLPDPSPLPPPGSIDRRVVPQKELKPHGSIRAAAIGTRDRKGVLLLVTDLAGSAQIQPQQLAINELMLTVIAPRSPGVREDRPGGLRWLDRTRVPGGTRVKIQFGVTASVLFTTDIAAALELEAKLARFRPQAVQLAIDKARLQFNGSGRSTPSPPTTTRSRTRPSCWPWRRRASRTPRRAAREDYEFAWRTAHIATRPLRILMQGHVSKGVELLIKTAAAEDDPDASAETERDRDRESDTTKSKKKKRPAVVALATSSPPCVAFNTLPQHFRFLDWIKDQDYGANLVPSGSFQRPNTLEQAGWEKRSYQYDDVDVKIVSTRARSCPQDAHHEAVGDADPPKNDRRRPPFLDQPAAQLRAGCRIRT